MKPRNPFDDDYVEVTAPKVTSATSEILLNPFAIAKSPAVPRPSFVSGDHAAKAAEEERIRIANENQAKIDGLKKMQSVLMEEEKARMKALQEEAQRRQQEEERVRLETEERIREETERRIREETERRIQEETERRLKEELELEEKKRQKEEEEEERKLEEQRKAKEAMERKKEEDARKAKEEEDRKNEEARKAKEEEDRKKEAERKAKEEERKKEDDRKAKEEAERKVKEDAKAQKEAEKRAKEEEKAREKAEKAAAKAKAKEEAERKKEEERKAAEKKKEDERKAKEEADRKKEEERRAKEEERKAAEKRKEDERKAKEEEKRKKDEEERKKKEEADRRKEEEKRKKQEEDARKDEEERKRKEEEEGKRKEEEERKRKEEEERKRKEDDERKRKEEHEKEQLSAAKPEAPKDDKALSAIAKVQAKEEADRRAVASKLEEQQEESLIFFESNVESGSQEQHAGSAKNPMLQRLHLLQKRNSFAVVQIESDSEGGSSDAERAEEFIAQQMTGEANDEPSNTTVVAITDTVAKKVPDDESGESVEDAKQEEVKGKEDAKQEEVKGKEDANLEEAKEKDLEQLMVNNPIAAGNKIRIKIKNFEDSSSDDENVIAGGENKRSRPAARVAGGGMLAKPPTATLSGAPAAGPSRRRKPIGNTADMFAAPLAAPAAAPTESVIEAAFPSSDFGAAFPVDAAAAFPAPVVQAIAVDSSAPLFPSSFEEPKFDTTFPAASFPAIGEFSATFPPADFAAAFPPPADFAAAFPPADFAASFPPAEKDLSRTSTGPAVVPASFADQPKFEATFPATTDFAAAFPAAPFVATFPEQPAAPSFVATFPEQQQHQQESAPAQSFVASFPDASARPAPPSSAPVPPKSQPSDRVPVAELKEMFTTANPKGRRLPAFPEEDMFSDRQTLSASLRCTEMLGAAIRLLDVKSVRLFLQAGFNPESQVEDGRDFFGKPLQVVCQTWLNLRRSSQGSEEVKVQWNHTLGTVSRVAQMKEMVAICKLLLLKGAAVTPEASALAQELKKSYNESRLLELLSSFPSRNELESILTFPSPPKTEEENLVRTHLQKTSEILRVEHLKTTDPKVAAEAEKEYTKKLKKLPRAVVKKHVNNRVSPLLSPLLRASEQIFVVCAVFDVIGVLNFLRKKDVSVNERVESWFRGEPPTRLTPLEVMCKFWVNSDGVQRRTVFACVDYTRNVAESDCIEAFSALLHAGAEVTSLAREFAADKGPILKSLLEDKKAPKIMPKKDEPAGQAAAAAAAAEEPKRKFKFGAKKDDKKTGKLTFGRSKTAPLGGIGSSKDSNPAAATAVGAAEEEESSD